MADEIHKYGTDDGWHGVIKDGGEFPPEKDRYHLYIGMIVLLTSYVPRARIRFGYSPLTINRMKIWKTT